MTPDVKLVIIESPTNPRLQARRSSPHKDISTFLTESVHHSLGHCLSLKLTPGISLGSPRTPTRTHGQITDIKAVVEAAHAGGALVCVDNSIMAMFQQPLVR